MQNPCFWLQKSPSSRNIPWRFLQTASGTRPTRWYYPSTTTVPKQSKSRRKVVEKQSKDRRKTVEKRWKLRSNRTWPPSMCRPSSQSAGSWGLPNRPKIIIFQRSESSFSIEESWFMYKTHDCQQEEGELERVREPFIIQNPSFVMQNSSFCNAKFIISNAKFIMF